MAYGAATKDDAHSLRSLLTLQPSTFYESLEVGGYEGPRTLRGKLNQNDSGNKRKARRKSKLEWLFIYMTS